MTTPTSQRIHEVWESGFVNRWHSNPCSALRNSQDTTDAHSNRVAKLVIMFTPLASGFTSDTAMADIMVACAMHDTPEIFTGDVGNPAKRRNPELKKILKEVEDKWLSDRGFTLYESKLLKMCDLLDAILFAKKHAPERFKRNDWCVDVQRCVGWAGKFGLESLVLELINEESS